MAWGPDSVIDAVGMEAHGSPAARLAQHAAGMWPEVVAKRLTQTAIDMARSGGTSSLIGVYGGIADPLPMRTLLDKQVTLWMR